MMRQGTSLRAARDNQEKKSFALSLTMLILVLTLLLTFTNVVILNLWVLSSCLLFLLVTKRFMACLLGLLLPVIPALTTYWSVLVNGSGAASGLDLATRTFAFTALGLVFTVGVDLEELLLVLEQKGLPANFVYGLLVVIHALPIIRQEVNDLKEAALFRGQRLHFWTPLLYFKVILVAFEWQAAYTEAMYAHGYDENSSRSQYVLYQPSRKADLLLLIFLVSCLIWVCI